MDAKNLISELNSVATSRTPSQIEIRPLIKRETGKSDNVKFDPNQNRHQENMRNNVKHDFQKSIEKMNNNFDRRNDIAVP